MKLVLERRIGETRAALYQGKKCVELFLARDSEAGRPAAGDVFSGRVRSVDTSLSAAFIDLGDDSPGFLNFSLASGAPRFREGQMLRVSVTREAEGHKGPILQYVEMSEAEKPGRESGDDLTARLKGLYADLEVGEGQVPDFMASTELDVALKGGGSITIEPTRAITAIDVDTGPADNKRNVAIAAAKEAARQIRLRGIGGLVLIDFPNLRKKKDRDDLWQCLVDNFDGDPRSVKIAPISRFGTIELTRTKTSRSLMEMMLDRHRLPTAETLALEGLHRLVREGRASGGAQLELILPKAAYDWLMADKIAWRAQLNDKIGARYSLSIGEYIDVRADR